jgi:hypothetical protein
LIISSTVLPVISDGNFGEPATGATAVLVPLLEGTTRVVCVVVAELVAGAVVEVEDGRLNENAGLVVCGCEDDAGVDVFGTANPVKEFVDPVAGVELAKPNPVVLNVAAELAGVVLVADEVTPKEGKAIVEAGAEEAGALVAAGVEEEVVVVVAMENTAPDVLDAGAAELPVERLKPELADVPNEKEDEDEAVCGGAEGVVELVVELAVLFKKENPVEAENGEAEAFEVLDVDEELKVDTPNGDGEEVVAPDEEDAKRDGVEPAEEDEPKNGEEPVAPKIDGEEPEADEATLKEGDEPVAPKMDDEEPGADEATLKDGVAPVADDGAPKRGDVEVAADEDAPKREELEAEADEGAENKEGEDPKRGVEPLAGAAPNGDDDGVAAEEAGAPNRDDDGVAVEEAEEVTNPKGEEPGAAEEALVVDEPNSDGAGADEEAAVPNPNDGVVEAGVTEAEDPNPNDGVDEEAEEPNPKEGVEEAPNPNDGVVEEAGVDDTEDPKPNPVELGFEDWLKEKDNGEVVDEAEEELVAEEDPNENPPTELD